MYVMLYDGTNVRNTDPCMQEITLADLFHLPYGHVITSVGVDALHSEKWPSVARFVRSLEMNELS